MHVSARSHNMTSLTHCFRFSRQEKRSRHRRVGDAFSRKKEDVGVEEVEYSEPQHRPSLCGFWESGQEKRNGHHGELSIIFEKKRGCGCYRVKRARAGGGVYMPQESKSQDMRGCDVQFCSELGAKKHAKIISALFENRGKQRNRHFLLLCVISRNEEDVGVNECEYLIKQKYLYSSSVRGRWNLDYECLMWRRSQRRNIYGYLLWYWILRQAAGRRHRQWTLWILVIEAGEENNMTMLFSSFSRKEDSLCVEELGCQWPARIFMLRNSSPAKKFRVVMSEYN
jgi:hypothetical protein